jgi:hypothetical protein
VEVTRSFKLKRRVENNLKTCPAIMENLLRLSTSIVVQFCNISALQLQRNTFSAVPFALASNFPKSNQPGFDPTWKRLSLKYAFQPGT